MALAGVQDAVGPGWIAFHAKRVVVEGLSLEGGSELYLSFIEYRGDVAYLFLEQQLIVIEEKLILVGRHGLNY